MADEKEGTAVAEPVVEQKPPEPEKPPFTLEDVKNLIVEERKAMEIENQKTFKGIQRVVDKKDREISGLKSQLSNPAGNVTGLKELADAIESGDANALAKAKAVIAQAETEAKRQSQFQYQERIISENQTKFNEVIEKAGLDIDDPRLVSYELAFEQAKQTGDFTMPEKTLNKLLKTITPAEAKKEEPKVDIDAEVTKRVNAKLVELGVLKADGGAVAGGADSWKRIRDSFIADPNNPKIREAYLKSRRDRGI